MLVEPSPVTEAPTQPLIRWDILAEHLEQGAVLFERFERARVGSNYTLDDFAQWVEAGWLAHLDALMIAGSPAIDVLLGPLLAEPKPSFELMTAASVVLLAGRWTLLQTALWSDDVALRNPIVRVCSLFGDAGFDAWVASAFAQAVPPYRLVLLELAAARRLALPSLSACLRSESEAELAAAARAALHCDRQAHFGAVEALIEHPAAPVRDAAIVTALHWGSHAAWQRCRDLAAAEQTCSPRALRLLALLGDPRDHGYVLQAMRWAAMRPHAIRSLGFTGNLAAVEHLLALLAGDDRNEALLASEALTLITDIDPNDETLLLEVADDDGEANEDAEESADVDEDITPGPGVSAFDPAAAREWWANNQGRQDPNRRNIRGRTDMPGAMLRLLAEGRMRDRPDVALGLAIRTGGRARVDCDALVARQRQQLDACAGSSVADLFVRHSSW